LLLKGEPQVGCKPEALVAQPTRLRFQTSSASSVLGKCSEANFLTVSLKRACVKNIILKVRLNAIVWE